MRCTRYSARKSPVSCLISRRQTNGPISSGSTTSAASARSGVAGRPRRNGAIDPTAARLPPQLDRLLLMRERCPRVAQRPRRRLILTGLVGVGNLFAAEKLDQRAIAASLGAVGAGARVELAVRERIEQRGRSGD